jgi:hypothetical protein
VIHVLLTPAGEKTTEDNLGVLQVGCMPGWAADVLHAMAAAGWTVSTVEPPLVDLDEGDPVRVRGLRYFEEFRAGG